MENKYVYCVSLVENGQLLAVSKELSEDDIKEVGTALGKLLISSGAGYLKVPEVRGDVYIPLDVVRKCLIRIVPV